MVALLRTTYTGKAIGLMALIVGVATLALGMVINSVG
jgi:hypothetical protein